ncbi:Rrf2 family transcriptional regulator [Rapidithrix thailandica]|uniref:Rrf2 family transcriptional regulator n=1 Tax=Rapidithrix thailandica TaxID=413964 RepID=A0AAW9SB51_9BACT
MTKSKFAISVHILTLLTSVKEEWLSSEYIAGSLNMNPVLVRNELSNLKKNQLVESKEGKGGGVRLAKAANKITLGDIFTAIKKNHIFGLAKNEPNPKCPVGNQINRHLTDLFAEVDQVVEEQLHAVSLGDFQERFEF